MIDLVEEGVVAEIILCAKMSFVTMIVLMTRAVDVVSGLLSGWCCPASQPEDITDGPQSSPNLHPHPPTHPFNPPPTTLYTPSLPPY